MTCLISDHLGSTSIVTNSSGAMINQTKYKAWGETRYSSGTNPSEYTYTGQYSYTNDFGLMFYNARWYDSSLGRFAQADTIVPGGVQGLDRYAYVNNSPVMYIDPSGHFSEDAIEKYLKDYCKGKKGCYNDILDQWRADKDWWDMLLEAEAGDVLFGGMEDCANCEFTLTFTGEGQDVLTGITGDIYGGSPTLLDVQQGKFTHTFDYPGTDKEFIYEIIWLGFYRQDERGKPSFYVRGGYDFESYQYVPWVSSVIDGVATLPVAYATIPLSPWITIPGGLAAGAFALPSLVSNALNVQPQDAHVQIGPVHFVFSLDVSSDTWIKE